MTARSEFETRQLLVEARLQADSSETERELLTAAEVGDTDKVRELLDGGLVGPEVVNLSGRTALELAVDSNNVEIVEYLLPKCTRETVHRAMLCAVENDRNFIFEIILQHPMYSDEREPAIETKDDSEKPDDSDNLYQNGTKRDKTSPQREPSASESLLREALILAAIEKNFPIVRTLVLRKAFIERPHDYFCICGTCSTQKTEDMMRYTKQRLDTFKALASPAYISVTAKDPIIAAFQLSRVFYKLTEIEIEYKQTYLELDQQCQQFAIGLIAECRSSVEVSVVLSGGTTDLDGDGDEDTEEEDETLLPLLKLAMRLEQKKFVAHPSCQAQVAQLWFSGVPALRYLNRFGYLMAAIPVGIVVVPILSLVYLLAPWSRATLIMNTPIMRFVSYTCSYITFLILVMATKLNFGMSMDEIGCDNMRTSHLVFFFGLVLWVFSIMWEESKQIYDEGGRDYFSSFWNVMDTIMLSLYMCTFTLELIAPVVLYRLYRHEYARTGEPSYCPLLRAEDGHCHMVWEPAWVPDPSLLSDITFSIAVLLSIGRFSFIMPSNEQFGTMLVSFRRTGGDIFKLCSMFILTLIAFACGMAVLYGGQSCNNTHFNSLAQTCKTLIWAMFGMGDSEYTDVRYEEGSGAYVLRASITSNVGAVLFGVFVFATAVVLMNLLIAMMANTFQEIQDDRDVEWKFGRTELWLNFIEPGSAVPPPFNIIPSTQNIFHGCRWVYSKLFTRELKPETVALKPTEYEGFANEGDLAESRQEVMSTLVRRYVRNLERERLEQEEDSTKDEMLRRALDRVTAKLEKRLDNVDEEVTSVTKEVRGVKELQTFVVDELKRLVEATLAQKPPQT